MEKPDFDTPVSKGSGVTPNNPFRCDMTLDDARCRGVGDWLYRTATTTKVVCDGCAVALRSTGRTTPVEFHLCELATARDLLVAELSAAKVALDGTKDHLRMAWRVLDRLLATPIVGWFVKRQLAKVGTK